ncbi:L-threonylcarbamoyladenylate synthase [Chelatococcus asaccharovorans]|uniref:Threonylcarbamoyl-AMP synthase n=1 Tax=Chelatococcus asaccharovorans TaxID=28210 RepID=A0A2V3U2E5_9HYPH|nr:L-threonylcarbamoyladenylate synthase [Chelatococcus asaccharovorans]MBS7702349.1 threonylcarbamoyl-AMP synthase [Chelatococcus asaccharovorans]PXW56449.1 translation factor SUA5 [Chelatococcus asaccharovorans]
MATSVPPDATECLDADAPGIARAASLLKAGRLVAFPTETVYGLGGDATQGAAVAAIYAAKGRPRFNPLIAHVADFATARKLGEFNAQACKLADAFWPGPLTLVVPRTPDCPVSSLASAGLDSIAIRIPAHPVALDLLRATGRPLAAPSANPSGGVSPTTAAHVLSDLDGVIAAVIDGGATVVGVESTVVSCLEDKPRLLRPGGTSRRAIEAVLGTALADRDEADATGPHSPGQLASHYAPHAPLRMDATTVAQDEAVLLFGKERPAGLEHALVVLNLSESGDLIEAAANLFSYLRRLDRVRPAAIAVAPIPDHDLGEAINDRLRRAAAPR